VSHLPPETLPYGSPLVRLCCATQVRALWPPARTGAVAPRSEGVGGAVSLSTNSEGVAPPALTAEFALLHMQAARVRDVEVSRG
jgi:hypothetical protein